MRVIQNSFSFWIPLLIFLLLFVFWQKSQHHVSISPGTGESIPSFNLPTLYHPEKRLTNEDLKGQVVLLNFWASWCSACSSEHTVLVMIKDHYQIPIIGINFNDNPNTAKKMLKKRGNPYAIVGVDQEGELANFLKVDAIPQTFLIDKHERVRYHHIGVLNQYVWENKLLPVIQRIQVE